MIYIQTISALLLVLGLIGLFHLTAQRWTGQSAGRSSNRLIQVLETRPLGDKRSLMVVRVGEESFLIGATSSSISLLASLETLDSAQESLRDTPAVPLAGAFLKHLKSLRP